MKLEWTEVAVADRERVFDYIELDNPRAAIALDRKFEEKSTRLKRFPHIGRPGRVQNTRELVAHRNYILVYEIDGDTIRVLRLLHSAQDWPPPDREK